MIFRTAFNKSSVKQSLPFRSQTTVQINKEYEDIFTVFWALFLTSAVGKRKQAESKKKGKFLHTRL